MYGAVVEVLSSLIALVVTLGILVTVHEFGHFWVARQCGVKVLTFSIGFGKPFKKWTGADGVDYVLAPIPLGGFVRMLGENDFLESDMGGLDESDKARSFESKSPLQRIAITAAGPIANFLLAIIIFWLVNVVYGSSGISPIVSSVVPESVAFVAGVEKGDEILSVDGASTPIWRDVSQRLIARMGETGLINLQVSSGPDGDIRDISVPIEQWMNESTAPDPLRELGIIDIEIPAIVGEVFEGGAAEESGLLAQDKIVRASGREIRGWAHWVEVIQASPELETRVVVEREGQLQTITIIPERKNLGDGVYIGVIGAASAITSFDQIVPEEMRREVSYSIFEAIGPAVRETWDKALFILGSVKKMVIGLISIKNVNGPITIAQVAGNTVSYGLNVYLQFLGLLSISLGVMNLLPIPVLDGGRLLFIFLELVTGSPLPERIQAYGMQIGVMLISGIMLLAVFNDVNRLF